jgi:hypothetical protein
MGDVPEKMSTSEAEDKEVTFSLCFLLLFFSQLVPKASTDYLV